VMTALAVGHMLRDSRPGPVGSFVPTFLAVALLWVNVSAFASTIAPDAQRAVAGLRDPALRGFKPQPLAGLATSTTRLLSEDPYVPISLGQRPVVLDPFMLLRIGRRYPAAVQALVDRIRARDFELVVLIEPLQPVDRSWWTTLHFGPTVVEALAAAYQPSGM